MKSRVAFFNRVAGIHTLLATPYSVDVLPPNSQHNIVSRMIRASLVLSSFSYLEAYLEDRVFELMPQISRTKIPYAQMHDRFRKLVTIKALQGVANRLQHDKNAPLLLAEENLRVLSKIFRKKPAYSAMGFSPFGSNISSSHLGDFISDLGCPGGWNLLSNLANIFSYNSPQGFAEEYKSFGDERNLAAHDEEYNILSGDLENLIKTSIRVGVAFDLAATFAARCYRHSISYSALQASLVGPFNDIAIVQPAGTDWTLTIGTLNMGIFPTESASIRAAKRAAPFVISRTPSLIPTSVWSDL